MTAGHCCERWQKKEKLLQLTPQINSNSGETESIRQWEKREQYTVPVSSVSVKKVDKEMVKEKSEICAVSMTLVVAEWTAIPDGKT